MLDKKFYYALDSKIIATVEVLQQDSESLLYFLIKATKETKDYPGVLLILANKLSFIMQEYYFNSMHMAIYLQTDKTNEYIKLIPVYDDNNNLDILAKTNRIIYLLFGHQRFIKSQHVDKSFLDDFSYKFINDISNKNHALLEYPKKSIVTNYKKLYIKISRFLQKPMIKYAKIPQCIDRKTKSCAFCNPKVLANQVMYTCDNFNIIINFAPYGTIPENAHFLIAPVDHHEDWRILNDEQIKIFYKIAYSLNMAIKERLKDFQSNTIGLLQNGINSGQTVPHCHFHVFHIDEDPLKFLSIIKQQFYTPSPIRLTDTEMQDVIRIYRPLFMKYYYQKDKETKLDTISNIYGKNKSN